MELVWGSFILLFFIGDILFLTNRLRIPVNLTPIIVIVSQTLVLYLFSLVNLLNAGFFIVLGLSILPGLWILIRKNDRIQAWKDLRSPGVLLFAIVYLYYIFYTRGTQFYSWDEFSHWGVIFRHLMQTNRLPDPNSCVFILNYPPFTALYQYFIARIVGFQESSAYLAQVALVFSGLYAVVPTFTWRQFGRGMIVLGTLLLALILFDYRAQILYVDGTIGVLFGVGLAQLRAKELFKGGEYILVLLVLAALPLIKPTASLFALIIAANMVVIDLIQRVRASKPASFKIFMSNWRLIARPAYLVVLLVPILVSLSWNWHIRPYDQSTVKFTLSEPSPEWEKILPMQETQYLKELSEADAQARLDNLLWEKPRQVTISLTGLLRNFSVNAPYQSRLVISTFIKKLAEKPFDNARLPALILILLILGITAMVRWILRPDTENGQKLTVSSWLVAGGFLIYCLSLVIAYIYYFTPYEGSLVPTVTRYLGSYLLGWSLMVLAFLATVPDPSPSDGKTHAFFNRHLMTLLLAAMFVWLPLTEIINLPPATFPTRPRINFIYKWISEYNLPEQSKVFHIWQRGATSVGFEHFVMRYLMCPVQLNKYGWRLGERYDDEDMFTARISPADLMRLFAEKGYTHVLISTADQYFVDQFGSLFNLNRPVDAPILFEVQAGKLVRVK